MTRITGVVIAAMLVAAGADAQGPPSGTGSAQQPGASAATAAPAPMQAESTGYTYNPEGRRDPFVSLMRRGGDERTGSSMRPAGLPGLATAEVSLKGTMQSRTGYVALVQGADNKTYIVREGDRLLDGTVRTISQNAMVILQQVNDPLSLDKQREVRKLLRQADEVK
jgi:Tfp pilus assembly protein PilP